MIDQKIEALFNEIMLDLTKNPQADKGHIELLQDLLAITVMARNFEFHDFKNTKYAAPKATLHSLLMQVVKRVEDGGYDN